MKAVVLEVRPGEAAILTMDGIVRRVRGQYEVGQEIDWAEPARPSVMQWVAALLVAAILITGSAGLWISNNYVACAEVSLDAGPSIVYTLNRRNRVLSVEAVNEDAVAIVEALGDVRFKPVGDAVEMTVEKLTEAGYLDADAENHVLAGVSSDDTQVQEALAGQVEAAVNRTRDHAPPVEVQIERTDRATAAQARERGMSPGGYAAWNDNPDDPKPAENDDMPVRESAGEGVTPPEGQNAPPKDDPPESAQAAIPDEKPFAEAATEREIQSGKPPDGNLQPQEGMGQMPGRETAADARIFESPRGENAGPERAH